MLNHGVTSVIKPEKVWAILDAVSQFNNTSLNEKLIKRPDYLSNLIGILLRFRQEPFGFISEQM